LKYSGKTGCRRVLIVARSPRCIAAPAIVVTTLFVIERTSKRVSWRAPL
jgi:hypothetical protein